jgi:hypothetical protein
VWLINPYRAGEKSSFTCLSMGRHSAGPFCWPLSSSRVDFLRHYGLLVDSTGNQLVDCLMLQASHSSPPLPGGGPESSASAGGLFSRPTRSLHEFAGLYPSPGPPSTVAADEYLERRGVQKKEVFECALFFTVLTFSIKKSTIKTGHGVRRVMKKCFYSVIDSSP